MKNLMAERSYNHKIELDWEAVSEHWPLIDVVWVRFGIRRSQSDIKYFKAKSFLVIFSFLWSWSK